MTPDANKHVSGRLFHVRRTLADFETGRRTMTIEEARELVRVLKEIGIQAVRDENRLLQIDLAGGRRVELPVLMADLYEVPDGCIDLSKVMLDYAAHPAELGVADLETFARRLIHLGGDALRLVHEVSMHRWNSGARQEREDRMIEGAEGLAADEALWPGENVVFLNGERPFSDGSEL